MAVEGADCEFFISYTQADRAWAEWIAWILEENNHRVLVQAWDGVPGSNRLNLKQAGTAGAERTIAILSNAYLKSDSEAAEWLAAWEKDPDGAARKLLVVRVGECDRPGLLSGVVGIDLFGLDEAQAEALLLSAVADTVAGRAKPGTQPLFPGVGLPQSRAQFPGALPSVWKAPARNPYFIGRTDELDRLARDIASESRVVVQSFRGMGGVGKTQMATEFAHLNAAQYDVVWWIDAEKAETIPGQIARLAAELGLESMTEPEQLQAQVHRALQGRAGWLLVFDNADQVDALRPWLPSMPLRPGVPGHVIVTTRRGGFGVLGEVLKVDVLDLEVAVELLSARVSGLARDLAEEIAKVLGRLPLALEQAAAYLDRTQMPADEFLELLKTRADVMLDKGVWALSFERLLDENPSAMQLMDVCAYLAPDAIPLRLFTEHADLLPAPLSDVASDPLAFGEAVAALLDYSLVKRADAKLQIHRLVQADLRSRHTAASSTESWAAAVRLLWADTPATIIGEPQNWPRWEQLLPHVLGATGFAEDLATPSGEQATMDTAWLLARAATYLQVHARPSEARPLMEHALQLAEANHTTAHADVATILSLLATILRDLGDIAGAEPLLRRALEIAETTNGSDHPDVATPLGLLGRILRDLGDAAGAKPLMERALRITETTWGPSDHSVAIRLRSLAGVLRDLGEAAEARPLMERALAIDENNFGPDHAATAHDLNNLALILRDLGKPAEARPLMERALQIKESTYGPDHPEVASGLSSMALILQDLGDAPAAQPLMERALQIRENIYESDHPEVASSLSKLAMILQDRDDTAAAKPLMERALHIYERTYAPDHPTVIATRSNLTTIAEQENKDS
jgi:tetratricopeptide (TPR) repeat protein